MDNKFDDIRPYYDSEIPEAMQRIAKDPLFPILSSYVFPEKTSSEVAEMVRKIKTIREFQLEIMNPANMAIGRNSISKLSYSGFENINPGKAYIYLSNHRDIMLDAALLQTILIDNGLETTEITFGANLMQGQLVIDVGKSNKMFKVERPGGNMRDFFRASVHLSDYMRTCITQRKESMWIAQRNGRTKDGVDRTDQGIINMFRMSAPKDMSKTGSVAELHLLPVAISYEWEPCGSGALHPQSGAIHQETGRRPDQHHHRHHSLQGQGPHPLLPRNHCRRSRTLRVSLFSRVQPPDGHPRGQPHLP